LLNVYEIASINGMAEKLPFYQPQFIPAMAKLIAIL